MRLGLKYWQLVTPSQFSVWAVHREYTYLQALSASLPIMMPARSVPEGALPGHRPARPSAAMMRGSLLTQDTMGCNTSSFRHCIQPLVSVQIFLFFHHVYIVQDTCSYQQSLTHHGLRQLSAGPSLADGGP